MKRLILNIAIVVSLVSGSWIASSFAEENAAEVNLVLDESYLNNYEVRNPFQSRLPEKPQVVEPEELGQQAAALQQQVPEPVVIPPTPPTLTLTGLVWNTNRPQAIINGQVLDQGDTIDGAQIVSIQKTGVELVFAGTNMSIKP